MDNEQDEQLRQPAQRYRLHRPRRGRPHQQSHVARHGHHTPPGQHRQRPLLPDGEHLRRRARHRPGGRRVRRLPQRQRRLRENLQRPSAQLVRIHAQQHPGLHLAAHHAEERRGAGRRLRIHLRRQDVAGGRICRRPEGGRQGALREAAEVQQHIALQRHVGPDDEEHLQPRRQVAQQHRLPPQHRVRERQHRHQPHLSARSLAEGQDTAAARQPRPPRQQAELQPQRLLRLCGGLHGAVVHGAHHLPRRGALRRLAAQGHRQRCRGRQIRLRRALRLHEDHRQADCREEQVPADGRICGQRRGQRHLAGCLQRAPRLGEGDGRRRHPDGEQRLHRRLHTGRGDHHQPEHHRCRHRHQRLHGEQHRLQHAAQVDDGLELGLRLYKGLQTGRHAAVPQRETPHQQGEHGQRAAEEHPLGTEHGMETREPATDEHPRLHPRTPRHPALEHQLHGRVRAADSRCVGHGAGQRQLHRRLREQRARHHPQHPLGVDARQHPLVDAQRHAHQRPPHRHGPRAVQLVLHRPPLHPPQQLAHSRSPEERPRAALEPLHPRGV